jgi:hypothetical protein
MSVKLLFMIFLINRNTKSYKVLFEDVDFYRYCPINEHHVAKYFQQVTKLISKTNKIRYNSPLNIPIAFTLYSKTNKFSLFFFKFEYVDRNILASILVFPYK